MIDRKARDKAALAVRRYASGRITNDALEEAFDESDDLAIDALRHEVWAFYSDMKQHKAKGRHALSKEQKRYFAELCIFLKSDQKYVFPDEQYPRASFYSLLFSLVTFGRSEKKRIKKKLLWDEAGNIEFWPFQSEMKKHDAIDSFRFLRQ
jgi:hypothetical protein